QTGQPAPPAEPAEDLGNRRVTDQETAIREDELHDLETGLLAHPRVAGTPLGRLTGQELEIASHCATRDPGDAAAAQAAVPVVDQDRASPGRRGLGFLEPVGHGRLLYVNRAQRHIGGPAWPPSSAGIRSGQPTTKSTPESTT